MYPLCTRTAVAAAADRAHRAYSRAAGHFLKCEGYIFKSQGPQLTGRPICRLAVLAVLAADNAGMYAGPQAAATSACGPARQASR